MALRCTETQRCMTYIQVLCLAVILQWCWTFLASCTWFVLLSDTVCNNQSVLYKQNKSVNSCYLACYIAVSVSGCVGLIINYVLGRSSKKALMSSCWLLSEHLTERAECKCEKFKTCQCTRRDSNQWPLKCKTEPLSFEPFCSLNLNAGFFNRTAAIRG
jgi:hypothetical protein